MQAAILINQRSVEPGKDWERDGGVLFDENTVAIYGQS
jgi:hypothetical protein